MRSVRRGRVVAIVAVVVLVAGCSGTSQEAGPTVEIFGPYVGREADAFAASMEAFEDRTGIDVLYTGSVDFTADLGQRAASGVDAPDIALVPQPGVVVELIRSGQLLPLGESTRAAIVENYSLEESEIDDLLGGYAVPYRTSLKSLVWYRPDVFAQHGWQIPATMDDLLDLVDDIGGEPDISPWCFSIYAGASTGWPATDWVEDLLLRHGGAEIYDEWTSGEADFADPVVREAFVRFEGLVVESGSTAGGLPSILQVEVDRAWEPLLADPPGCALYKQASFASTWLPDDLDIGPEGDLDFFVLPGVSTAVPAPLVTAGDVAVQFVESPEASALMTYLATPESGREWARAGGYTSERTTADEDDFSSEVDRRVTALLSEDDRVSRFDGSDLLPPVIGSDLMWEEMTSWIAGTRDLDVMLDELDTARDRLPAT